ncbi:hypothetical protein ABFS82_13G117200 [Erythranthe guttata]
MKYDKLLYTISLFFIIHQFLFEFSIAVDTLAPNQTLTDNGTTIVSRSGTFELGFFSPSNSDSRYIGIWFKNVPEQTLVWVANRNSAITDSLGTLSITPSGNIIISRVNQSTPLWSANSPSRLTVKNPILKLLDNGNLVLMSSASDDNNSDSYVWQSFDYPSDTLIPGMKLGWNLITNQEWYLTSWKSTVDPSPGEYTYRMNPTGLPSIILRRGSVIQFRSGPWDGVRFGGAPVLQQNTVFKPIFAFDSKKVYYAFENTDQSIVSRFVVNQSGLVNHLMWSPARSQWTIIATMQADTCDEYSKCGNFGVCDFNKAPICACLRGFSPRVRQDWARFDWEGGCVRNGPSLNCSGPTGFRKFSGLKVPDTSNSEVNSTARSLDECEGACLRNCSCVAYAVTEATGCVLWFGDLVDIRVYAEGGQELFVRMPLSELGSSNKSKKAAVVSSVTVALFLAVMALIVWLFIRRRAAKNRAALVSAEQQRDNSDQENRQSFRDEEDLGLPLFDFLTVSAATDEFSFSNKIGEGGFGPVYKGVFSSGKEIAVKRLSKDSGQGLKEFKNEVMLMSKLQHRNLVRLLGCCIQGDERMLIYEYMPNKSLDLFIFNQTKHTSLHWETRFDIIMGIARGLLYLHRDSRLRIIHRDLKASNILLDSEMNPKISDFGLARIFGGDQNQENTKRVMGTYGYMAPEYAVDGLFSVKSDVFSFGVLVLEILSGKKNRGFYHVDHDLNLLGHAWKLWNEEKPMDFLDGSTVEVKSASAETALRCIQIGLLCVQQRHEDRPTMSNVLVMLENEQLALAQPKQPGFYTQRTVIDTDSSSTGKNIPRTSNEITVTLLHGR